MHAEVKHHCSLDDVNDGSANLLDGHYLFVVMVGSPDEIRLLHEQDAPAASKYGVRFWPVADSPSNKIFFNSG